MTAREPIHCDLCIVGTGMAGMSAALFAANRGLRTALVGRTGEIIFATSLIDLMGVHPVESGTVWADPWAAIAALVRDQPRHPYALLPSEAIRSAIDELLDFLEANEMPFRGHPDRNVAVLTALGTAKTTYRVPLTFWAGVEARERKRPCLLADVQGLKGFSARQIASAASTSWPGLRTTRLVLPRVAGSGEVFAERLARALELDTHRRLLAEALAPHLAGVEAVGLPAILGISRSVAVLRDVEQRLGMPLFEIPTMPPGTTGLRLKETFERGLGAKGVTLFLENRVLAASMPSSGDFVLEVGRIEPELTIRAPMVILATGRFMGGGLKADRQVVRETLFDLPVHQPAGRAHWHREEFLDPRGHPVNRAGVCIDASFRPLDAAGRPVHARLFAAGSILAHQDWMRMKCGSGLAIASAWAAVGQAVGRLGRRKPPSS
ncbi:MAG: glycerol-3-phosphate dehydrogenase subunit GlpB [Desulfobacterales bacterium]|jgi:glycerol-3-phosphate dehydrogenase subunit B|nr:glycerol-3-phosphate dehydrogenase subunit GlpB [Desulfobacterales bacterium]